MKKTFQIDKNKAIFDKLFSVASDPGPLRELLIAMSETIDSGVEHEIVLRPVKKGKKKRTLPQNAALHLAFSMLANDLDAAGLDQKVIMDKFRKGFSLPVTDSFMKTIFRECGFAMFKKKSTSDLTTTELTKVWQAFDMAIAEKTGVSVEFPSWTQPPREQ